MSKPVRYTPSGVKAEPRDSTSLTVGSGAANDDSPDASGLIPTHSGPLPVGGTRMWAHNMPNGLRILEKDQAVESLFGVRDSHLSRYVKGVVTVIKSTGKAAGKNGPPDGSNALKDLVLKAIDCGKSEAFSVPYVSPHNGRVCKGITHTAYMQIVKLLARALREGVLTREAHVQAGIRAQAILEACADIGLAALIDEATGHQRVRPDGALKSEFDHILGDILRPYSVMFGRSFWEALHEVDGIEGPWHKHPPYYGNVIRKLIYEPLAPGLSEHLAKNRPKSTHGARWHQWLREDTGVQVLRQHIDTVTFMARSCQSLADLIDRVQTSARKKPMQRMFVFILSEAA